MQRTTYKSMNLYIEDNISCIKHTTKQEQELEEEGKNNSCRTRPAVVASSKNNCMLLVLVLVEH